MRTHHRFGERGFSLVEMLIVVAILGTVAAMSTIVSPAYSRYARAETSVSQTLDILRSARELAISQRRNIEVRLVDATTIETARVEFPSGARTVLRTVRLENRAHFMLPAGVPDRPGPFVTAFPNEAIRMFTSEGTFTNQAGDPINGSVFVATPDDASSARAVAIFGPTAALRAWRWDGTRWVH